MSVTVIHVYTHTDKSSSHRYGREDVIIVMVSVILFKANFNDSSVISWRSFLLVNAIGIPGEDNDLPKVIVKPYHTPLYRVYFAMSDIRTHNVSGDWPIAYVAVYPTTVRSRPRRPRVIRWHKSKY